MECKKLTAVILLLLLALVSVNAVDLPDPAFSVSAGLVVDIAPFGVEQLYPTLSAGVGSSGSPGLRLLSSLAMNGESRMLRLPIHFSFDVFSLELDRIGSERLRVALYGGGGLELYRSELHDTESPLLEAGFSLFFGRWFIDARASRAYRSYNVDSDVTVNAGVLFEF